MLPGTCGRGVELVRLTQEEILAEAAQTEIIVRRACLALARRRARSPEPRRARRARRARLVAHARPAARRRPPQNRASLERMLRIEEEKRRDGPRVRNTDGPRVVYRSKRSDVVKDALVNTISFVKTPVPSAIDGIAPPYPGPVRCVVTGLPAKYRDPLTGSPYATIEAFRTLRGRGGRRQQQAYAGSSSHAPPED